MNSKQLTETLEQIVLDLKGEAEKPFTMPENVDLREAMKLCERHLPPGYLSIDIELNRHSESRWTIAFKVYDGKNSFTAQTLSLAVQKAITANLVADAPVSPVAAVEKALETVQPDPFAAPVNL